MTKQTTKSLIDKYTKEILDFQYYEYRPLMTTKRLIEMFKTESMEEYTRSKLKQLLKEYDAKKKYA